jgi:hypothetical protein
MREVHSDRLDRDTSYRTEPFTSALPAHSYQFLLVIDVVEIDADNFADP